MKKILILCTGNSCRSQMAEGYLKKFSDSTTEIYSAGVETHGVNPKAVKVMLEDDVDISRQACNHVDEYSGVNFDYVITVCDNAKERCPYFPNKARQLHQNFPDPAKVIGSEAEVLTEFRRVRDLIKAYCKDFAMQLM